MKSSIALTCASILLSGCYSLTYEGAGDHRFVEFDNDQAKFALKFSPAPATTDAEAQPFKRHDPISIYLKNAFFAWCPHHWYEELSAGFRGGKPKCRVAVVVNVGSRLEQVVDRGGPENPGRIVFYSRDIQKEQFINQSFGTVYSDPSWDGNDLTLDVTVLQLPEEDNLRADAVLKVLAGLGSAPFASFGGQQLLGALNRVGSAFVQASAKDSVMGFYRVTLLNKDTDSKTAIPVLREGDLVLMRAHDDTRETLDWQNYVYDPAVGKLFQRFHRKSADATERADAAKYCDGDDYRKLRHADLERVRKLDGHRKPAKDYCYIESHHRNYLVFSLVKQAGAGDWMPTMTLPALQQAIQSTGSVTALQQAVSIITDAALQRGKLLQGQEAFKKLKDPAASKAVKSFEAQKAAEILQCGYVNSLPTRPPAGSALEQHAIARCGGMNWASSNISSSEFEYLARKFLQCNVEISELTLLGDPADGSKAEEARKQLATDLASCPK